jgi:hypothetical protein
MSISSVRTDVRRVESEISSGAAAPEARSVPAAMAWSSFFFALLQSFCTFFGAANGLRLLIGVGALAVSASVGTLIDRLHADWFRLPMNGLALAGALLNLAVLAQLRWLRNRPAAQWRQVPVSAKKLRSERWQLGLSIATLVLVVIEESLHFHWHRHF